MKVTGFGEVCRVMPAWPRVEAVGMSGELSSRLRGTKGMWYSYCTSPFRRTSRVQSGSRIKSNMFKSVMPEPSCVILAFLWRKKVRIRQTFSDHFIELVTKRSVALSIL